jgi:hypothetical protein
MFSGTPGRNHPAPGFRGYEFGLPERTSYNGRDAEFDYIARGGYRDFSSSHSCHHDCPRSMSGQEFGWGREGRVRLEPPRYLPAQVGPRPFGGLGGLNINRGSAGGPLDYPFRSRLQSLRQRPDLPGDTLIYRRPVSLPRHGPDDIRSANCYCGRVMSGALGISDFGSGPSGSPLGSVSEYSLHHLDRLSKPYHYQPPYAEEYESDIGEEPLRSHEDLGAVPRMIPRGSNFTNKCVRGKGNMRPR